MKITGYRTALTQHDWRRRIGDANGALSGTRIAVPILILTTDEGLEGVGVGAYDDIARLWPAIEGEDPRSVMALYGRMLAQVFKPGHAGATFATIGAIDMALWDLKAKAAGEPLWRLLGGRDRFVPAYASGLDIALDDDELHAVYSEFAERGFAAGKLKGGNDLQRDLRRIEIVRQALAPNSAAPAIMFDANESWTRSQAVRYLSAIEAKFDVTWVEEPVRRWDAAGLASVRSAVRAAVATGENLTGLEQFRPLLDADAVDIVQPGASWGVTHMLRLSSAAHAHDLVVSPVGYNFTTAPHVSAAIPNHLATEVQDVRFPEGISIDVEYCDGGIVLGDTAGSGVTIDESIVAAQPDLVAPFEADGPYVRPSRAGLRLVPEQADQGSDGRKR